LSRADSNIADADRDAFVKGQYDLNFDLIRKSADQIGDDNAMISTFSLQTALAMTWAGADGDTASEMAAALHFDDNTHAALNKLDALIQSKNKDVYVKDEGTPYEEKKDAVEIKTTNDLYFSTGIYTWASAWLDLLAVNYGAGLTELNFQADIEAARKYINDRVSDATHDRIKDLLPENSIDGNTRSVITNAIYFKAPWRDIVNKANDKMSFHKLDGSSVDVDYLLSSHRYEYMAAADNLYQAVSVPLRDDDFKVLFVLPDDGKFNDVQAALNGDLVGNIFDKLAKDSPVNLGFPSYSFETELTLKEPLKDLGMVKAFDEMDANFSKMTDLPNDLYIGQVYHKTFVGLDEKGVEAAAATAVVMESKATPGEVINLDLDKPYFFIIYESDSKSPLFVGRVMDPSK
jgi:serpin B